MSSAVPVLLPYVKFDRFDPDVEYFDPLVYLRADKEMYPCVKRFDSATPFDKRCSVAATNMIVRVLNRDVVSHCWELKGMAAIGSQIYYPECSPALEKELDGVHLGASYRFIPPFSFYRDTQENAPQIELIHRTANVLHAFYPDEVDSLQVFLKPQEDKIFGVRPGSVADAVAKRIRGDLKRWGLNWEKTLPAIRPPSEKSAPKQHR